MMDKNARTKLRNMGGIMASSPELMRVAQGFQVGGPVMPQAPLAPRTSGVTRPGTGAPLVGLGRVTPMMPGQGAPGAAPMMPPESAPGRFVAGQPSDTSVADGFFGLDPVRPAGLPGLADQGVEEQDIISELIDGSGAGEPSYGGSRGGRRDRRATPTPSEVEPSRGSRGRGRLDLPERETPGLSREEKAAEARRLREQARQQTGRGSSNAKKRLEDEAAQLEAEAAGAAADSRQEYFQQGGPSGLSALATPIQTSMDDPETVERMQTQLQKVIKENQETTDDTDTDTPDGPPPPAPSKKDLRGRYKEKLELFKEIYGEKDEDRARDKAMSLAMIGLAIAAGQSPDALTNISQGLSVGLQGMGEQNRARQERDRGLQTLALETAIGEQSAEAEAAARAAEQEAEFQNKLDVANIRAAGGAGPRFSQEYTASRLKAIAEEAVQNEIDNGIIELPDVGAAEFFDQRVKNKVSQSLALQRAAGSLTQEEYESQLAALGASSPPPAATDDLTEQERKLLGQ